jgi:hypothetical protein
MMEKIENFDIRVLERKIRKGEITREEYEKHLASLKECVEDEDFTPIEEETLYKNAGIKKMTSEEKGTEDEQEV